ncbi:uncharacterized protein LOC117329155 [Pecten maximus]|uniref:uncharacterized protein LOC117329155 n=1 Tax=Pecten maximus TaxID=6579 RepID=UPI001457F40F|nr:uncharacterized protein LOC117329155 [Pecten maximus]
MPKRRVEHDFDIEKEPDDSKRARKECSIDRRGPSRTPIHRHESASSQGAWRETEIIETLQKEIEELKKSMKILQEDNKSLSDGRANATKALNVARDEAARYKKQMEASDGTVARNQQEFEQLKIQFKDLHDSKKNDLQRKDELDRILQQSKANERNLQNALSAERQAKDEALISLRHGQSKEENLRDTIDRLQKNLSSEREAKDEALIRLSAVAGNKLRDNNPDITDLSDPNRPMKLAEKVSELYDNEWTNAMENLENDMEEKDAIEVLLDIVTNVFKTCEEIGDAQTDYISNLELPLAVPDIDDLRDVAKSSLLNKGKLAKLPTEITKPLKDYRKTSSLTVSPLLFEVMKSRLQTQYHLNDKTIKACEQFIKETVLYVWMMRVQDPPVHIEWEFSHGEKFDHDRLRSYTKGGDSVDYVVWPILYLHKGGPMLAKGVAQGMKTKSK